MTDLLRVFGFFSLTMALSFAFAYAFTRLKLGRRQVVPPAPDSSLQIASASGSYRSRFLEASREGWRISAPLQRDRFVPLRIGESLVLQSAHAHGVRIFRTEIIGRCPESHTYLLRPPQRVHDVERRSEPRDESVAQMPASVNGVEAILRDISMAGVRLVTSATIAPGDLVRVEASSTRLAADGWVLDSKADSVGSGPARLVRIRLV